MPKSKTLTYILWFIGGWFGLHHFYLGRDRHGFVWCSTLGGFILGWIRDLWRIPDYVLEANSNEDHRKNKNSLFRFCGQISMGCIFGSLIMQSLPKTIKYFTFWYLIQRLLTPLAVAIGVHLVGNIGNQKGALVWAVIASYIIFFLFGIGEKRMLISMSVFAALTFNWNASNWRPSEKSLSLLQRLFIIIVPLIFYYLLLYTCIYYNTTITYYESGQQKTINLKEASQNFFESQEWKDLQENFDKIYEASKVYGWKELLYNALKETPYYSLKVLGLNEGATDREIIQRYRKLVKKWHPDKQKDEKSKKHAEEKFMEIQKAYENLRFSAKQDKFEF